MSAKTDADDEPEQKPEYEQDDADIGVAPSDNDDAIERRAWAFYRRWLPRQPIADQRRKVLEFIEIADKSVADDLKQGGSGTVH